MTTIAWDGKTIASDSQINGSYSDQAAKIFVNKNEIIAGAGTYSQVYNFAKHSKPITCDETHCIVINRATGTAHIIDHHGKYPVEAPQALGTGCDFAMGAILNGADAESAVKIAIQLDANSGGAVQRETINDS